MRVGTVLAVAVGMLASSAFGQWGAVNANSETELVMEHCGDKFDFKHHEEPKKLQAQEEREDRDARRLGYFIYVSDRAEEQLDRTDAIITDQLKNRQ